MHILIIGSGGREHAIAWKIAKNPKVDRIVVAPGNDGMQDVAQCMPIASTDIDRMVQYAKKENFDLVVVAPDNPLALGMVDAMERAGIRAFGPNQKAAIIEASKVFSKQLMEKYGIPTAQYKEFRQLDEAILYLQTCDYPCVVKADGLALGKGVIICQNKDEAERAVQSMLQQHAFGDAGDRIIIEEFLVGHEVSILAFTDGRTCIPMVSAQDHKRVFDHDQGPNTGGMGAFAPSPYYTPEISEMVKDSIMIPTINAMNDEGRPFKGVLYFGLMLTEKGPKVLEYNARFGDPETQVVLPLMQTDLIEIMEAIIDERLSEVEVYFANTKAVCVVMSAKGYPGDYQKGDPISTSKATEENGLVFYAGVKRDAQGVLCTNGGRVLGVTCLGDDMRSARDKAYNIVNGIQFNGAHYRTDIGEKAE